MSKKTNLLLAILTLPTVGLSMENAPQTPEAPVVILETPSSDERSSTGSVDSAAGLLDKEPQPSPEASPIRQRRALATAASCMGAVKAAEKELTKKVNETFAQDWRRSAAKFAALGSLAAVIRHYFDNSSSVPLQIKWAEQVSNLVEKMPTPKPIPLKVLAFATKIAAMYGASYGLNILDDYIINSQPLNDSIDNSDFVNIVPWSTNLGIVTTWAASQTLSQNLKKFCELPESYFTEDSGISLEVFDEERGIPEGQEEAWDDVMDEESSSQQRSAYFGNFGSKLGNYLKRTNGYRLSKWLISKRPTREVIRFAANGISSAMIHHRLQSLGFVPTIKFAENINALVKKIPTPKPVPLYVAAKIAQLGALYGSSYALAYLDDYLAKTYGFQTNYQTAAILASIMNFSENIGEVVKYYENKDNQQAPPADLELTRVPAAAQ